jgi:fimbrial isopeptide formation D2 family protein/LPXTG-motif cell wall-anchored protein
MMKRLNKLLSTVLALAITLIFAIPAFAEGTTCTITINNPASGHTYEAYQIFTGDLSEEGVLSNVTWGSGVNGADLLAALRGATISGLDFSACTDAASVAKVLSDAGPEYDAAASQAFAQIVGQHLSTIKTASAAGTGNYTISGLDAGYYLVKDQDGTITGNDAYTRFILQVVEDVTVAPKSGTVTVEKKVKDINNSTETALSVWQDSADHDIGDVIPFQLKGTLPANYDDYTTYKYTFHDTESAGLTFDPDSVVVKADGTTLASTDYSVVTTGLTDGCTFEVQFANLKAVTGATISASSVITVEYNATLNENAVLGSAGNPNTVYLEFSNNSNQGSESDTGKTPTDTVIVFTYMTVVSKVDQNNAPLTGAEFTLEKLYKGTSTTADSWKAVTAVKNTEGTTFTFSGLDDGSYRLTETTTPAGYNSIDPIYFTVTAAHDVTSDSPALTALSASQTDKDGASLTTGTVATFTAALTDGSLATNIVNKAGATLPSTGGIGTRIFTVGGVVLILVAGVLYTARRKASRGE